MTGSSPSFPRSRPIRAALLACALTLVSAAATAETPANLEYQVKASYLYNFLQFIDWPSGAHGNAGEPLVICILGPDRFGTALEALAGETVRGRPLVIRRPGSPDGGIRCHVAFISASDPASEDALLHAVSAPGVLTIGESRGFAERGGIINLVKVRDRIRFEINPRAAQRAGFRISSQLLQLAILK